MSETKEKKQKSFLNTAIRNFPVNWTYSFLITLFLSLPLANLKRAVSVNIPSVSLYSSADNAKASFPLWNTPFIIGLGILILMLFLISLVFLALYIAFAIKIRQQKKKELKEAFGTAGSLFVKYGSRILFFLFEFILLAMGGGTICYLLFLFLPNRLLKWWELSLPFGYHTPPIYTEMAASHSFVTLTGTDWKVLVYRIVSAVAILFGNYLMFVFLTILIAMFITVIRGLYRKYTAEVKSEIPGEKNKTAGKKKYRFLPYVFVVAVSFSVLIISVLFGIFYEDFDEGYDTSIVAHRAGGVHASENSLEGIRYAIHKGVYASEVDVQRTRDNFYIINHDSTFERLLGEPGKITDMTWEEMQFWLIPDTTGNGRLHRIPLMEEVLDEVNGREKLFIELKGASADRRMVDDIMKMVGERGEVDNVVLISFHPEAIEYAEEHYPQVKTGILLFGKLGGKINYPCDILLLDEGMASYTDIQRIKEIHKEVGIWTVNDSRRMNFFLRSKVDYIITDEIDLMEEAKKNQDSRTDREQMRDMIIRLLRGGY